MRYRRPSAPVDIWPPLFADEKNEPRPTLAARVMLVAMAELAGLIAGVGLVFAGSVLYPPKGLLGASNSGTDRVIGTVLLIISPLTAAFGPAYGYWKIGRSRRWFVLGAVCVMAAVPVVVAVAAAA